MSIHDMQYVDLDRTDIVFLKAGGTDITRMKQKITIITGCETW